MKKILFFTGIAGLGAVAMWSLTKRGTSDAEKWATSPGTSGVLNLDAVKEAFQTNQEIAAFEKRVNEIFEGDNLVLLDMRKKSYGFDLSGMEDLNKNKEPDSQDELLFTLAAVGKKVELQGEGVNRDYFSEWAYDPEKGEPPPTNQTQTASSRVRHDHYHHGYFHRYYWWGSRPYFSIGRRYNDLDSHRSQYRQTSGFQDQINGNNAYMNKMHSEHGGSFSSNLRNPSDKRQSYVNNQLANAAFVSGLSNSKTKSGSGWGARDSMAASGKLSQVSKRQASSLGTPFRKTARAKASRPSADKTSTSRSSASKKSGSRSSSGKGWFSGFGRSSGFRV